MRETFDVIVVGVGAMGAAACRHLGRRGARVLGIERFDVPHDRGSSGGDSRMIRAAYFEHPDYVPLARRAYQAFAELSHGVAGEPLLERTGVLYIGPGDGELITGVRRSADQHGIATESLSAADASERFPAFRIASDLDVIWERDAGLVRPEATIERLASMAVDDGVVIHGREQVVDVDWTADGASVKTDRSTYSAGHVVFTQGPWSVGLLASSGVRLEVTRQPYGYVAPRKPALHRLGVCPAFAIEDRDVDGIYYGFPVLRDEDGLKLGHHAPGRAVDPDDESVRVPLAEDEQGFRPCLERYLPEANGPLVRQRVCFYTMSTDGHFIVDRHPDLPATLACGFSGHGFKFAPVIGHALAELALDGRTGLPVGFLGLDRLRAPQRTTRDASGPGTRSPARARSPLESDAQSSDTSSSPGGG